MKTIKTLIIDSQVFRQEIKPEAMIRMKSADEILRIGDVHKVSAMTEIADDIGGEVVKVRKFWNIQNNIVTVDNLMNDNRWEVNIEWIEGY